jgi:hypothetical protein
MGKELICRLEILRYAQNDNDSPVYTGNSDSLLV